MLLRFRIFLILLLPLYAAQVQAEPHPYVVDVPMREPEPGSYIRTLLEMSLNASKADDEIIDLQYAHTQISQERRIAEVQSNLGNNLIWVVTDQERETLLRPIRFSFFKGLYGYRLLVIRKKDRARFAKVQTRSDLAKFVAGQGTHWPDSDVLRANHLPLKTSLEREQLYKMLAAGRFDYFPRSITEIWREEKLIKSLDLIVEPHLVLYYPTALYFFVNHHNDDLAGRLERGISLLEANGELDKLLFTIKDTQLALTEFKANSRQIIQLTNPHLPSNTPEYPPEYWINEAKKH